MNPLVLQWVKAGDCWKAKSALIRGLRVTEVQAQLRREAELRALFNSTIEAPDENESSWRELAGGYNRRR